MFDIETITMRRAARQEDGNSCRGTQSPRLHFLHVIVNHTKFTLDLKTIDNVSKNLTTYAIFVRDLSDQRQILTYSSSKGISMSEKIVTLLSSEVISNRYTCQIDNYAFSARFCQFFVGGTIGVFFHS